MQSCKVGRWERDTDRVLTRVLMAQWPYCSSSCLHQSSSMAFHQNKCDHRVRRCPRGRSIQLFDDKHEFSVTQVGNDFEIVCQSENVEGENVKKLEAVKQKCGRSYNASLNLKPYWNIISVDSSVTNYKWKKVWPNNQIVNQPPGAKCACTQIRCRVRHPKTHSKRKVGE